MSEMTLRERVQEFLQFAINRTAASPSLRDLHRELQHCREQLEQPMRVAIVGLIKAGKSTLMNALLGEMVVAMGTVETTFNVNVLHYGEKSLIVQFKDGHSEPKSFAELDLLTRRAAQHLDYLRSVKYIAVSYPNPILQTFSLVDTPGLASSYEDDSQNTRDFLRLYGEELTQITRTEAANADAVLYLFSHSLATGDQSIIEQFQGPGMGDVTPINSIGVLTKIDIYWPDRADPLEAGHQITRRLQADHPQVPRLFYSLRPVCGILALGAQTLTAEEFTTLTRLAALPLERFERLVSFADRFAGREYPDVPVPAAQRQPVLARLGQYGVWLACRLIREGVTDRDVLVNELQQRSGLPELRELIRSHFGNRAFLIKLDSVLRQLRATCWTWTRQRLNDADRRVVGEIAGRVEALGEEHAFRELRVLRSYYEKRLNFTPKEGQQLLQITGEYGTSLRERLGLDESPIIEETLAAMLSTAQERMRHWRQRAIDPGVRREMIDAADILAHSYERIIYHVSEARKHLSFYE